MGIKDLINRFGSKDEMLKQALEQRRVEKRVMELEKTSNERELERFMKEEREDMIKKELEEFRAKRQKEYQYGNKILQVRNMFKGGKNDVLKDNKKLLKTDHKLLKGGKRLI